MARLNDESQDEAVDSTEILSPQPFALQSKGFLVSSLETANDSYRADNVQMSAQDYEYNSSSSSARHSTSDVFGREMDDELEQLKSRASSHSSLSSIPASVLVHPVDRMKQMPDMDIHEKITGYRVEESEASFGDFNEVPTTIRAIRQREAVFRKPSSVRAMQMHTEDEADEDDYLTPPRRRAGIRSPGSSPLKRSPYYSPNAQKQPKPKEAPLVLLHCTLLPPSIAVPGAADPRNQDILEDELPMEYWKRWRRLQDRVGSGVVRDRGVLISHPEDLYDMLEERLLESLELQRPRLQNGHFVGREDHGTSGDDLSDIGESETDGEQGDECPDCGGHVRHGDSNRKWEIRVFAANGLMRAGAWAAAWRDMEKVDVEVGLWLPSDVRRGLERRLAEEQMAVVERDQAQSPQMQMMHMPSPVDGENQILPEVLQSPRQGYARMISDVGSFQSDRMSSRQSFHEPRMDHDHHIPDAEQKRKHEVALSTLFANYIRVLASDRRNMALALLSVLVALLAIGSRQQQPLFSDIHTFPSASYDTPGPSMVSTMSLGLSATSSLSTPMLEYAVAPATEEAKVPPSSLSTPTFESVTASEKVQIPSSPAEAEAASFDDLGEFEAISTESTRPTEIIAKLDVQETVQPEPEDTPESSSETSESDPDIAGESEESFESTGAPQSQLGDTSEPSRSVNAPESPDISAEPTESVDSSGVVDALEPQPTMLEQEDREDREEEEEEEEEPI
jgi:hypothetical protein